MPYLGCLAGAFFAWGTLITLIELSRALHAIEDTDLLFENPASPACASFGFKHSHSLTSALFQWSLTTSRSLWSLALLALLEVHDENRIISR